MSPSRQPPEAEGASAPRYVLRLYVAGASGPSRSALLHVNRLCEMELQGRHELHVIDVLRQPELARDADVIATPTLIKVSPLPTHRFFGSMEDTEAILAGLGLQDDARSPLRDAGPERSEGGSGS